MKSIGLIGGMSWESSVTYYQIINRVVKERLGGLHSAKCILYSMDFQEIEQYQSKGDWDKSAKVLIKAAQSLESAGADFIVLCTNTMHKVADKIQNNIGVPFLHIAECTANVLEKNNISQVGLLGTKYTMTQEFYKSIIVSRSIKVVIPCENDIEIVNDIIYNELCLGVIKEESKSEYLRIINDLVDKGAKGIILGCTEIGLLVRQQDTTVPLFDTAQIHAEFSALMSIK